MALKNVADLKTGRDFTDVLDSSLNLEDYGGVATSIPMWTKSEVITDDGDGTRTLLASETNTVFLIDDAALILILPTVSDATVGLKYKFVVAEEETTA